jgi:hypothetical protein
MKIGRLVQAASITGVAVFMMATSASAGGVRYNTHSAGTRFDGSSAPLNNSLGAAATLAATLSLIGGSLLGLGISRAKRSSRELRRYASGADALMGPRQFQQDQPNTGAGPFHRARVRPQRP